jgi:hypothetical protein
MRSFGLVLDSVMLYQKPHFLRRVEQFDAWPEAGFAYRNSFLKPPLNDSTNGLSQGDPGSM